MSFCLYVEKSEQPRYCLSVKKIREYLCNLWEIHAATKCGKICVTVGYAHRVRHAGSAEKIANLASWRVSKVFCEVCRRHTALDSPRLWRADLSAPCRGVRSAQKNACRRYAPSTANCGACLRHALCGCDAYPPPTTRTAHSLVLESRGLSIDMCLGTFISH